MTDIKLILHDIESLRDKLSCLIQSKDELLDFEILITSVLLDKALNDYDSLKYGRLEYHSEL
ncbi:MAG: Spo0E family sporulation regulatory protein-aspartic acid phosphatase [Pseudomonadota bacterium]